MLTEWAKTQNCDNKIIYKFNRIKPQQDTDTNKANPLKPRTWATLVCSTQSPNLASNSSYFRIFLKLVFVKAPGLGMFRWSFELVWEILKVPIFVLVFFILSIRNLDLQSGVCWIKSSWLNRKEIFKGNVGIASVYNNIFQCISYRSVEWRVIENLGSNRDWQCN